jgi:hypothetical protein
MRVLLCGKSDSKNFEQLLTSASPIMRTSPSFAGFPAGRGPGVAEERCLANLTRRHYGTRASILSILLSQATLHHLHACMCAGEKKARTNDYDRSPAVAFAKPRWCGFQITGLTRLSASASLLALDRRSSAF